MTLTDFSSVSVGDAPIFVRGLSRSGGTLLVTLLDAHPDIAMSYELYPTLLDLGLSKAEFTELATKVRAARSKKAALNLAPTKNFRVFVARAERGGLDHKRLGELMLEHCDDSDGVSSIKDRLGLIAACCREKMKCENKQFWGLKCNNSYEEYLQAWSNARFINIVRDGRDVLASQMNTGSFAKKPDELAKSWKNTHMRFRELMLNRPEHALEIKYEALVTSTESELKKLTDFLGIEFSPAMLQHTKRDLTLYKSSHLSMDEVKKPVNDSKVGRWRKDVSESDIQLFLSVAEDALVEFGYEV